MERTFVELDLCRTAPSSNWTFVELDLRRTGPLLNWDLRQTGPSANWTFIELDLRRTGPSSNWTFVELDLRRTGPLSNWTFIELDLCWTGPSSNWTFVILDLCRTGPSSKVDINWNILRGRTISKSGQLVNEIDSYLLIFRWQWLVELYSKINEFVYSQPNVHQQRSASTKVRFNEGPLHRVFGLYLLVFNLAFSPERISIRKHYSRLHQSISCKKICKYQHLLLVKASVFCSYFTVRKIMN